MAKLVKQASRDITLHHVLGRGPGSKVFPIAISFKLIAVEIGVGGYDQFASRHIGAAAVDLFFLTALIADRLMDKCSIVVGKFPGFLSLSALLCADLL